MNDQEFETLVERDIKHSLSEEELQPLKNDPERWKRGLVKCLQDVDKELANRKGSAIGSNSKIAKTEYLAWKKKGMGFKIAVTRRLAVVKAMVREKNVTEDQHQKSVFFDIYDEVREIRFLLENMSID